MALLFKKPGKSPKFSVGEIVRIKSGREIMKSLGKENQALDGCLFTEQMRNYCGARYEVLKKVNKIFDENKQRTFETRSTLYILKSLICDGNTDDFPHKCDRSCFLLWHEDWLEKT